MFFLGSMLSTKRLTACVGAAKLGNSDRKSSEFGLKLSFVALKLPEVGLKLPSLPAPRYPTVLANCADTRLRALHG